MSSDDIRAKRLAKLGGSGVSRPAQNTPNQSSTSTIESESQSKPSSSEVPKPSSSSISLNSSEPAPLPSSSNSTLPQSVANTNESIPATPPAPQKQLREPLDELKHWFHRDFPKILSTHIEEVTDPSTQFYVDTLSDPESESVIREDYIEEILMDQFTDFGAKQKFSSPIAYFHSIYSGVFHEKRTLPVKSHLYKQKLTVLNQVSRLSISYGLICFLDPEVFSGDVFELIEFFSSNTNTHPYLEDILKNSIEQESLKETLELIFQVLSGKLYKINLNDRAYANYLSLYELLVSFKPVASIFSTLQGFQPPTRTRGLDFEHKTILGALLRLSPLDPKVGTYYFTEDPKTLAKPQIHNIYSSVQNEYRVVIDRLFFIVEKLIRGSPQTREDLLKWFGELVNLSHLRRGSHGDPKKLPGDGMMYNISIILIKLSSPFLNYPTYSKIDKIDIDYFLHDDLIDISDESRVNSSIQEATDEYKRDESANSVPVNFISQCFYLSLSFLHYGMGGIFLRYDKLKSQIKQFEERIEMLQNSSDPQMMSLRMFQLPQLIKAVGQLSSTKHSIQALFNYTQIQEEIFDFIIGSTTYITRLIDPTHQYPSKKLSIPLFEIGNVSQLDDHEFLKKKTPIPWKYYPEFILEGMINYCKFSTNFRSCPLLLNSEKLAMLVEFFTILLRCPELIGNPHLKSTIVELLFVGAIPLQNGEPGFISPIFNSNKLVMDNLLYSLLDFYVMVEKTGASSQFYDKFNSRFYISIIIEDLWKNTHYRNQLTSYSKSNVDFFIRFIARMLNDTTYLLDETFNELNLIHNYQQELKNRSNNISNEEEYGTNEELTSNVQSSERKAKSYMELSNKTMLLFKLFTKEVPQGFVLPEIVDRLAGMLDYNLSVLVGPKCSNLKVENPEKYGFDPKKILGDLCEVYSNLSNQEKFVIAVSRDGRSFNLDYFVKAKNILSTKTFVHPSIIKSLIEFAERADAQRKLDENEELELGEIPDEFLDPLMFTLMEDPVILPSSRLSIDRSTIKAHLLSDATDPFNRMPLKLEDVIDDVELKQKIEDFKRSKRQPLPSKEIDGDTPMTD